MTLVRVLLLYTIGFLYIFITVIVFYAWCYYPCARTVPSAPEIVIPRARARSLTTVKLLYLVWVNRCSNMLIFRAHTQGEMYIRISM